MEDLPVPYAYSRTILNPDNNGDTVDLNEVIINDSPAPKIYGSSKDQITHGSPGSHLSTIKEEDVDAFLSYLAKNESVDNDPEVDNLLMQCVVDKCRLSIEKFCNKKITPKPALQESLRKLCSSIQGSELFSRGNENVTQDHQRPPIPPLPNPLIVDKRVSEKYVPEKSLLIPSDKRTDINMNISSQDVPNADDQYSLKFVDNANYSTIANDRTRDIDSLICQSNFVREPEMTSNNQIFQRSIFEDSLSEAAKRHFERISTSSTLTKTSNDEVKSTNPFKSNLDNAALKTPPSLPARNQLRRPHSSPDSFYKSANDDSQARVVYTAPPIIYQNTSNNEAQIKRMNEAAENLKERHELEELKRMNVESWIKGQNNNDIGAWSEKSSDQSLLQNNGESSRIAPPIPPRNFAPNFDNCTNNGVFGNGIKSHQVSPLEWFNTIDSAISFKTISDQGPRSRPFENGHQREDALNIDCNRKREIKTEAEFWAVQITDRIVYVISYQDEGWVALEEFAIAFTNKPPEMLLRILEIKGSKVPLMKIKRIDHPILFEELDRTSIKVPRDHRNKIGDDMNLAPLRSCIKILRKLKIVDEEQVNRARLDRIFPTESSALYDVYTLIRAYSDHPHRRIT